MIPRLQKVSQVIAESILKVDIPKLLVCGNVNSQNLLCNDLEDQKSPTPEIGEIGRLLPVLVTLEENSLHDLSKKASLKKRVKY